MNIGDHALEALSSFLPPAGSEVRTLFHKDAIIMTISLKNRLFKLFTLKLYWRAFQKGSERTVKLNEFITMTLMGWKKLSGLLL